MRRIEALAIAVLAWCAASPAEAADAYPARPIKLIVPIAAGGAIDYAARAVALNLADALGQPVVVDNRPGGNSLIGAELVAKAAPDGYTLLFTGAHTIAIVPSLYDKLPYDPVHGFAPVALCCTMTQAVVVNASLHVSSVKELVALARSEPGRLSYGSMGSGSSGHLNMEALKQRTGIDVVHVPYKGSAPAITDLVAGHINMMVVMLGVVKPYVEAGQLTALAIGSDEHSALMPQVPTASEAGLPGYETTDWMGLFAPGATPADIVQQLNATVNRIAHDPEFDKQRLLPHALEPPKPMSPAQLATFIAGEREKFARLVKLTGAKVD
jgi:tripartite-type tricarboxylate transporter receptor subunit TctC